MDKAADRVAAEPARADRTDRAVTELRKVRPALRVGPVSLVLRPVVFGIVLALVVAVFVLFCLDIAVGDTPIPGPHQQRSQAHSADSP